MKSVEFTIRGVDPVPKGRPRVTRFGTYTPKKTVDYEKLVRRSYVGNRFDGAILLSVTFGMRIPKSKPKRTQAAMAEGKIRPTTKPDADNLLKAVCDGLNGVAFEDDKQIVALRAEKVYAFEPFITVRIAEVGEDEE